VNFDENYTTTDHGNRDTDAYALAKYRWTMRAMHRLGVGTDARIANIGCGAGTFTEMLASAGYSVVAAEPEEAAYRVALARKPAGCEVRRAGLFEIEDGPYDVVIMHDVLEHIDAEGAALDRVFSLVRPGGHFIMSVPALDRLFGRHDVQLGHYRRYTRPAVRRAMQGRFSVIRLRYFGFMSIPVVWLLSKRLGRDYPQAAASPTTLVGRSYDLVCRFEESLPFPLGTSVLLVARRD